MAQMDAVLDKSRLVNGQPTSLAELGFNWISMDDGWQRCNCSVRQDLDPSLPKCDGNLCFGGHCSWHDAQGQPVVRKDRFPDMKKLVSYGHARQLKVGTYLNNCICNEHGLPHYANDVKWMVNEMGFDGVKIDNCGSSTNVSYWAELLNATGKAIRIENCHNSWPDFKTGFCPMNFFRTGGDISADINSIITEAYATVDAADLPEPRSRPGCWAYPDMSEVGNFAGPHRDDQERTHWGLWCVVSSPLILGFDMNDSETMDRVWPIITNLDALAISEAWIGHPGTLIRSYPSQRAGHDQVVQGDCDGSAATTGWTFSEGNLVAPQLGRPEAQCLTNQVVPCPPPTTYAPDVQCGLAVTNCSNRPQGIEWMRIREQIQYHTDQSKPTCLYADPVDFDTSKGYFTRKAATVGLSACPQHFEERTSRSEGFAPSDSDQCALHNLVHQHQKAVLRADTASSSNMNFTLTSKGELRSASGCLRVAAVSGVQLWAKPINSSSSAVLLINPSGDDEVLQWPVKDLPSRFTGAKSSFACQPGRCIARDVWANQTFPVTSATIQVSLKPWASALYILRADHLSHLGQIVV